MIDHLKLCKSKKNNKIWDQEADNQKDKVMNCLPYKNHSVEN